MSNIWAGRTVRQCAECHKTYTTPKHAPSMITCGTDCRNEREKRRQRLKKYGLSVEAFDKLWMAQGQRCPICGSREDRETIKKSFAVDHDHACCPGPVSCGKCVRGILCGTCNMGLGAFGDSIPALRKAIAYLEANQIAGERLVEEPWGTAWVGSSTTGDITSRKRSPRSTRPQIRVAG